jgi:hypothetical protein
MQTFLVMVGSCTSTPKGFRAFRGYEKIFLTIKPKIK